MRKIVFIFAMLMVTLSVSAQYEEGDILIQPRVGVTISNVTDGDKSKLNLTYGVEFERFFTDQLSFAAGVLFTDQGCKFDILYDTNVLGQSEYTKMNLYYGAIPITANYYILPGLALKAGIQPAFRVKANMEYEDEKMDFDKMMSMLFPGEEVKMNTFDLSIPVGLSFEYNRVTIDARYNIGVTNLLSGSNEAAHNKVFAITLGYKFGR